MFMREKREDPLIISSNDECGSVGDRGGTSPAMCVGYVQWFVLMTDLKYYII